MTAGELFLFISGHKLAVVSTVARSGDPQSALVGIAVTLELELVFDTVKSSRKYGNLSGRQECSFVIGWDDEKTVQYEGVAAELAGEDLARYQEVYFRIWPDGPARIDWPGLVYFVVRPKWIRYSDFAQNPPFIQEFPF